MLPRTVSLNNVIGNLIPGSRTFIQYIEPGFQGNYFEVTTFVGDGQEKQRLDFAFPQELFNDMSDEEIASLVVRANRLRRAPVEQALS